MGVSSKQYIEICDKKMVELIMEQSGYTNSENARDKYMEYMEDINACAQSKSTIKR